VTLRTDGATSVEAPVRVVDPSITFGVISDIDDTVMVTALPRPLLAAWNTFVLDEHARAAVPGMAVLYERLVAANPGAPVFYLSTGAWNVAPALSTRVRPSSTSPPARGTSPRR
jgi:phosphatidate phosphatase APP1